jgi:hypothetical protein
VHSAGDEISVMEKKLEESPWLIGVRAARANLLPGLVLQLTMLGIVLAYFYHEPTRLRLNVLAHCKETWGFPFSALLSICAGAILPEVFEVVFFQNGRLRKANLANLLFTVPFWGCMGVCVDGLYRMQAHWFGTDRTAATLIKKVAVDQFLYSAFFSAPVSLAAYDWHQRGRSLRRLLTLQFWRRDLPPTVIANWGVWIPLVAIIYSLPPLLQVPLSSLALTFWVLILIFITSH